MTREGKSVRLSVYFREAWMAANVEMALGLEGCKTDQEKSAKRGDWLALYAAVVIRQQAEPRTKPLEPNLLRLSPPDEVDEELHGEMFTDSKAVPLPLPAKVTAPPEEEERVRHKRSAF